MAACLVGLLRWVPARPSLCADYSQGSSRNMFQTSIRPTILYNAMLYTMLLCYATMLLYATMLYSLLYYSTILYNAIPYHAILYYTSSVCWAVHFLFTVVLHVDSPYINQSNLYKIKLDLIRNRLSCIVFADVFRNRLSLYYLVRGIIV